MAKNDSTRKYIEFNKNDLSAACQAINTKLVEANKTASELRMQFVAQVEKDHGKVIKAAAPDGYVYIGIGTNFGKLSGMYDLPSAVKKASSKAISLI
jgi:hypothetical protein